MRDWTPVSRSAPCEACGHGDWCARHSNGAWLLCMRSEYGPCGKGREKANRDGTPYWVHQLGEATIDLSREDEPALQSGAERASAEDLHRVYSDLLDGLRLLERHRDALMGRGLPEGAIAANGYRTMPAADRARLAARLVDSHGADLCARIPGLFVKREDDRVWWTVGGCAGLVIPARDRLGRIIALEVRREDDGTEGPRYRPLTSSGPDRGNGPAPLLAPHYPLGAVAGERTVRLTEGRLKGDVATAITGILTIALPGVSCWRPALQELRELGAVRILLAYDADWHRNANVARAMLSTMEALLAEGMEVAVEVWDESDGKGIDDLLAGGGAPQVLSPEAARPRLEGAIDAARQERGPLQEARQILSQALESVRADGNIRAVFAPPVLRAASVVAASDRGEYAATKDALARANVRLRDWEIAVREHARPALHVVGRNSSRPTIRVGARHLRDMTQDAITALLAANQPVPNVFQRGGELVRLRRDDRGARIQPMTAAAVRGRLARVADWVRPTDNGALPTAPPDDVVADLMSLEEWELPHLDGVVESPVFGPEGDIITATGYHESARLWYQAPRGLKIPDLPSDPADGDIAQARNLILDDLLHDFPFVDDASRAHALAAMLLPFARHLIDGPTPLHVISAPVPGTGKGLLSDAVCIPALGREPNIMTAAVREEEWKKSITATLDGAPVAVLIDNINHKVDSASLAGVLTARTWSDRVLGESRILNCPVNCLWLATGNNLQFSQEMPRRLCWIRLDARVENPAMRASSRFKHAQLTEWAKQHRGELIHAALVLVQAWLRRGKPLWTTKTMGRFEEWTRVMGGILQVAGVPGFLDNLERVIGEADDEAEERRAFVVEWWDRYGRHEVGAKELAGLIAELDLLPGNDSIRSKSGEVSAVRLGRRLRAMVDSVVAERIIKKASPARNGAQQYRLARIDSLGKEEEDPSPAPPPAPTLSKEDELEFGLANITPVPF